jgi:SAM-dependent methyltransferase
MNTAEHLFCSSSLWRWFTRRQLLPWVLSRNHLGDHLLEIGAGYGAATPYLRQRLERVTSLEYDHRSTVKLNSHHNGGLGRAVRGDAAQLPFPDQAFSSALAILVLHHLKSREAQDQMFAEVFRVLRPGGIFLAFEITDGWINRAIHFRSTFTPVKPGSAFARLSSAGFSRVAVDLRKGAFRLSAFRPKESETSLEPTGEVRGATAITNL